MGFLRNVVIRVPPWLTPTASLQLGIASLPISQAPEITDPGISQIGPSTNTDQVNVTNTFTQFGTLTRTLSPHTFKFVGSLRKNEFNSYNPATNPDDSSLSTVPSPITEPPATRGRTRRLDTKGEREAAEANLASATAVADSTRARFDHGLATLPDLSESKAAAAQANYEVKLSIGDEQKAEGVLSTTLIGPADRSFLSKASRI